MFRELGIEIYVDSWYKSINNILEHFEIKRSMWSFSCKNFCLPSSPYLCGSFQREYLPLAFYFSPPPMLSSQENLLILVDVYEANALTSLSSVLQKQLGEKSRQPYAYSENNNI